MDFWKNKKSQNPNKSMLPNINLKANKVKEKIGDKMRAMKKCSHINILRTVKVKMITKKRKVYKII